MTVKLSGSVWWLDKSQLLIPGWWWFSCCHVYMSHPNWLCLPCNHILLNIYIPVCNLHHAYWWKHHIFVYALYDHFHTKMHAHACKWPGVDRIFLYDHNSSVPLAEGLEDLIENGLVVVERFDGHHKKFSGAISRSFKDTAQVRMQWVE